MNSWYIQADACVWEMQAAGAGHLHIRWSLSGGAAIKEAYKEVGMLFEEEETVEGFVPEA